MGRPTEAQFPDESPRERASRTSHRPTTSAPSDAAPAKFEAVPPPRKAPKSKAKKGAKKS